MLNLFYLDKNFDVALKPEAMSIKVFKNVMDKYEDKSHGLAEITYIFHMVDFRTDYSDVIDLNERSRIVKENIVNGNNITVDEITKAASTYWKGRQPSMSHKHLKTMNKALKGLQNALDSIEYEQICVGEQGERKKAYDTMALKRIADIIKESPKIIDAIKSMTKSVNTEIQENTAIRGQGEMSIYEDG